MNSYILIFAGFAVVVVACIVFSVVRLNKVKNAANKYLQQHPNAVKLYALTSANVMKEGVLTIDSVDDGKPELFTEGTKVGCYLTPGQHKVTVSFQFYQRGVIKSTTYMVQPETKLITVEAGKNYQMGFDKEQGKFTFSVYNP